MSTSSGLSSSNKSYLISYDAFTWDRKWQRIVLGPHIYRGNGLLERGQHDIKRLWHQAWMSNYPCNFTAACLTESCHSWTVSANILPDMFGAAFCSRPRMVSTIYEADFFGTRVWLYKGTMFYPHSGSEKSLCVLYLQVQVRCIAKGVRIASDGLVGVVGAYGL